MTAAIIIVRLSNARQINEKIPMIIPFIFDDESSKAPTSFGFIFTSNGRKYEYGFTADEDRIYEEYLYEYKTAKPSKVFERINTKEYSFVKSDEKEFAGYAEKTTDNKLFLATATAWNCERTKDAYMWLAEGIDTFDGNNLEHYAMPQLENDSDGSLELFLTQMLHKADINISGYNFKATDMTNEDVPVKKYEIVTEHDIETDGAHKSYSLPFAIESEGTKRLFFFGPVIKKAMESGKTIVVDEIDDSMHPLLVNAIIELFGDREINKNGAQLIFNTHDVSLLSLDNFRRDQIYFAEKDNKTGVTDFYSLDEFSPRKTENIRKGYLQGRYGAIPVIEPGGLKW